MVPAASEGPLIAFAAEQVTGVQIQAQEGEPVRVTKKEKAWVIPSLGDLPAAENKVTELLSKLQGLKKGLPVATTKEALKRFKVADQVFERKLTLELGNAQPAILYLGDSAGFRRLFLRAEGDSSVYEAELGLFDVPEKADAWGDRSLLHLDADSLKRLVLPGLALERTKDGWQIADLAEGEEQDEQAVADAVRSLSTIDFLGVLGREKKPEEIGKDASTFEISAILASGESIRFRISKLAEGNDYLLEASNRPQRFTLADYAAEELTGIKRAGLLKEGKEQTATQTHDERAESAEKADQPSATETVETAPPRAPETEEISPPLQEGATETQAITPASETLGGSEDQREP